jgi:hypothetical protein
VSALATVEEFRVAMGEHRLQAYLSEGETEDQDALIQDYLDAGWASVLSALILAGFAIPVTLSDAGEHEPEVRAQLKSRNLEGAMQHLAFRAVTPDAALTEAMKRFEGWRRALLGSPGYDPFGRSGRSHPFETLPGLLRAGQGAPAYSAGGVTTQIQGAHGFGAGNAFAIVGNSFELADLAAGRFAGGIVLRVRSDDSFDAAYLTAGERPFPTHPYGSTPGERYLSADTPGLLVEDKPADIAQAVLRVLSASRILMLSQPAVPA